jgi:peptide/nickel transport system substrate-binding protein
MRKTLLSLFTALALVHPAHAATPGDTLVIAVPLDGIISFDPAESFETVSNSSLRNIYQTLLEPDHQNPQRAGRQAKRLTAWCLILIRRPASPVVIP